MTRSPQQKAARWLLYELAGQDIEQRTAGRLARSAADRHDRRSIAQGLKLLRKRGHAEHDPEWKRRRMPQAAWRLTPAGQAALAAQVASQAAREVAQYRSSSGEQPPPPHHPT